MKPGRQRYRIAMVAACPFPSLRGSQVLIRELAEALSAADHEVHIVTYPAGEHLVPVKNIVIHRTRPLLGLQGSRSWWAKLVLDLTLIVKLYRVVRDHEIDIIHAHNYEGPLVAYAVRGLLGVPVVYHSHNAMADELPHYFATRLTRRLACWVGVALDTVVPRRADHCIALTPELGHYLRRRGVARERISVIPPGVALPLAGESASARARFIGNEVILYAGNIDPYQRIDLLLQAFSRLRASRPQAVLVMVVHPVKSPAVRRRLAAIATRSGVQVVEAATFGAARRLLRQADVVVCPRTSWSGFPIKVINFMSFSCCIVVCKSAGKIVSDGVTGVVVDEDAHAMAEAIGRLLDDPSRRAALGGAARTAAEASYTWSIVLPKIEGVYGQLANDIEAQNATARHRKWASIHRNRLMGEAEDRISARSPARKVGGE